jgi:hypothetical protein
MRYSKLFGTGNSAGQVRRGFTKEVAPAIGLAEWEGGDPRGR